MSPSGTQVQVKVLSCLEQDVGRGSGHGRSARGSLLLNQTTRSRARSAIDPGSRSFEPVVESFGHFCGSGLCPEQERSCITTGVPEFCPLSPGTSALLPVASSGRFHNPCRSITTVEQSQWVFDLAVSMKMFRPAPHMRYC